MSAETISLIEELSVLSKRPGFANDSRAQAKALHLSKQISMGLQKPADAAIELAFYVRLETRMMALRDTTSTYIITLANRHTCCPHRRRPQALQPHLGKLKSQNCSRSCRSLWRCRKSDWSGTAASKIYGRSYTNVPTVRLLRPLAALGFVKEVYEKTWAATPVTHVMSAPPIQAAHIHL